METTIELAALAALREEERRLVVRVEERRGVVADAQRRAEMLDAVAVSTEEEFKNARVGPGAVVEARRAVESAREALTVAEESLAGAEAEHSEAVAAVTGEEHALERQRQNRESAHLREEAASAISDAVSALTGAHSALRRLQEIRERIATRYPLAPPIEAIPLSALASRVADAWSGADHLRWPPDIAAHERPRRFVRFVRDGLIGPLRDPDVMSGSAVLLGFGIDPER